VDTTDIRILEMLQEDGRRSYTAIARELGVSESNVRQRAKRLIRKGIAQIVAVANPIELGFGIMATLNLRLEGSDRTRTARLIADLPEVSYLVLCAGSADMLAEVVCRDPDHLLAVTERIAGIPGVDTLETFMYLRVVKESERWLTGGPESRLDVP
jgi:Lrp/AsnC family transcriptional regulator for asnA, asnC and gidA